MKYFYISLAIGTLIRFIGLDFQSLWVDELWSVVYANSETIQELFDKNNLTRSIEANPPLYYTFLYFWVKLFGDSPVSIRLPSAIAGILSIYYMYRYVKIFFNEEIAVMSSVMLSLSYASIYYSQEARAYSFLILFSMLSTFYWLKLLSDKNYKISILIKYVALIILTAYTHYFGFLLVCIQLGYWVFHAIYNKSPIKHPVIAILTLMFMYSPWIYFMINTFAQHGGGDFWIKKPTFRVYFHYLSWLFKPPIASFFLLVLAPLFIGPKYHINKIKGLIKKHFSINSSLFAIVFLLSLMVILPFLISLHTPILYPRYLLGIAPFIYLLISIWVNLSAINKRSHVSYVFLCCLLFLIYFLPAYYNEAHKQQWREATLYVIEEASQESVIVSIYYSDFYNYYFRYFNYTDNQVHYNIYGLRVDDIENINNVLYNLEGNDLFILEGHHYLDKHIIDFYDDVSKKHKKIYYNDSQVNHYIF